MDRFGVKSLVTTSSGVYGILPLGSDGDLFNLSPEEQEKAVTITIDHGTGRVPVYFDTAASPPVRILLGREKLNSITLPRSKVPGIS